MTLELHADLERLLGSIVHIATDLIRNQNGFRPFGYILKPEQKPTLISLVTDQAKNAPEILEFGRKALAAMARQQALLAGAIVVDVRVRLTDGSKTDAIRVEFDHPTGPVVAVLAYAKTNGEVLVQERKLFPGEGYMFLS